jgi:hypothetical protein
VTIEHARRVLIYLSSHAYRAKHKKHVRRMQRTRCGNTVPKHCPVRDKRLQQHFARVVRHAFTAQQSDQRWPLRDGFLAEPELSSIPAKRKVESSPPSRVKRQTTGMSGVRRRSNRSATLCLRHAPAHSMHRSAPRGSSAHCGCRALQKRHDESVCCTLRTNNSCTLRSASSIDPPNESPL